MDETAALSETALGRPAPTAKALPGNAYEFTQPRPQPSAYRSPQVPLGS
jgi:hypothetical protein